MDALGPVWPQLVVLSEVAAAMLLGGMIGYERETANKPAGFRTHMMLAGACALLVGLGDAMLATFSHQHPGVISADPFRLVGGVVTALGFIGAGTIFRPEGQRVEGLTTATSLLFSGGIGVCAAVAMAVRLVVEDGLPYQAASWHLWRDHRVFAPFATIQNWVEAGGKKGDPRTRDPLPGLGPGRLFRLHRCR